MNYTIITDLDGTLVSDGGDISDNTKLMVERLLNDGITIIPCTARTANELPKKLLETDIRYYVCTNGSVIYDAKKEEVIHTFQLKKDIALEILESIDLDKAYINIIKDGIIHSESKFFDYVIREWGITDQKSFDDFKNSRVTVESGYEFVKTIDEMDKLHMNFETTQDKEEVIKAIKPREEFILLSSHPLNLEITNSESDKGRSALYVMNLLNLKNKKIIAFGDNFNDIHLFKVADIRVKMKNGVEELREHTNNETVFDNDQEGVATFLEDFIYAQ